MQKHNILPYFLKSLELQLTLLNLHGICRIWFLYSNAATAAFVLSSSKYTNTPKKSFLFTKVPGFG